MGRAAFLASCRNTLSAVGRSFELNHGLIQGRAVTGIHRLGSLKRGLPYTKSALGINACCGWKAIGLVESTVTGKGQSREHGHAE